MINLLPPDTRQNYTYARRNSTLLKWCVLFLISIAGVGLIVAGGLFYINQSSKSLAAQNALTQQSLKDQKIDEVQKEVQDIASSLRLTVQVLSKQILFSELIKQIGSAMPPKAALADLNITKTQGGIDLTAIASDYETASQVQINLADPKNQIFDKADLISINCNSSETTDKNYPCNVKIRAQFAKNNPFMFIGKKATP